jgi:hypothetical protein
LLVLFFSYDTKHFMNHETNRRYIISTMNSTHLSSIGTVLKDSRTGISRHCGFVEFKDPENASEAAKTLQGHVIDGMTLDIEFAIPMPDEAVYPDRIYISQLPSTITEPDLRKLCEPFGEVTIISINTSHLIHSAGQPTVSTEQTVSAFVTFTSPEAARSAQASLNGTHLSEELTGARISVAMARKYRSRRPMNSHYSNRGYNSGPHWSGGDYGNYRGGRGRGRGGMRGGNRGGGGGGHPMGGYYNQYPMPPMGAIPYDPYFAAPMYPMYYPPAPMAMALPPRGGGYRRGGRDAYPPY